jgi:hypothetical protein
MAVEQRVAASADDKDKLATKKKSGKKTPGGQKRNATGRSSETGDEK